MEDVKKITIRKEVKIVTVAEVLQQASQLGVGESLDFQLDAPVNVSTWPASVVIKLASQTGGKYSVLMNSRTTGNIKHDA